MGRYPLKAAVEKYLEMRKLQVEPRTLANESGILRHIADELESMKARKRIRTTHPRDMGPAEIRVFLDWMRDPAAHKGKMLDPDTQVRYLSKLEGVLKMNGNGAIGTMRVGGYSFPQKSGRKPIRAMSRPDLSAVQGAAQKIGSATGEPEGWRKAKASFLMTIYTATGLRPSELRLVHMADVDLRKWKIFVRTPKGAGKWGETRTITIMPPGRPELTAFLREREQLLHFYGKDKATYLIPNLREGKDGCYGLNHFWKIKKEVQELSGVSFKLKDFRPTFATLSVEMDPNLLVDVSAQLGHSNLATTQRYYAQISAESAGSRLEKAWNEHGEDTKVSNKGSNEVSLLLEALGISSITELRERLSQAQSAPNRRIDPRSPLSGYF